jgi:hypothetical protein
MPARRLGVGAVVSETFSLLGRHLVALVLSAFVIFFVIGILTAILSGPARDELSWGELLLVLLAIIIRLAAEALYTGFVVRLVERARGGDPAGTTVGDLFSSAAPAIPSLIAMAILFGIATGIGLILLVIPGLILLTIWPSRPRRSSSRAPARSSRSGAVASSSGATDGPSSGRSSSSGC